jgi:glutaminyl-tRNA synthetase
MGEADTKPQLDFVRMRVVEDLSTGRFGDRVITRFPPEPNGFLHIGHAKSICLNFGIAEEVKAGLLKPEGFERPIEARCNMRFDDTNPTKEEQRYIDAIKADVRWLGFDWGGTEVYASDYFDQLYEWACDLIRKGKAYVDDESVEAIRAARGTLTQPGRESPHRNRSVEENLDLFTRMKAGEFPNGSRVLRAKIDMASANMNLRDPVLYRILHAHHPRTGDKWCIYPMYDFAHGQSDSIEGITHSICTLEFEAHRPLYDWVLDELDVYHPQQIEFARLNLTYAVMSKRKLLRLVSEGFVTGWDDPRMPTISGMRRRGYSPQGIRKFCETIGVTKFNAVTEFALLEHCLRDDLNDRAPRVMGVLDPLKVVITNWPQGKVDDLDAVNNPGDPSAGMRKVPFTGELFIEREDFMEDPPKKFFRLSPGREVRLRYAYFITCNEVVKNDAGEVVELRCTYDPATRGGDSPDGRKVKGTLHWASASHSLPAEVRIYDHLFLDEDPEAGPEGEDFTTRLNPNSLTVNTAVLVEPSVKGAAVGTTYQFERLGYFCLDPDSTADHLVFNRTLTLKDSK